MVNGFEEIVGIITIEDVLEQVLGRQIVDEFDKYENLREVAALEATKEAKTHKHVAEEPEPSKKEVDTQDKTKA